MPIERSDFASHAYFTPDGRMHLDADHPAISRFLNRSYLSPSASASLHGCVARFAAERILPRIDDPMGPAETGTAAHAVLEDVMRLPTGERTLSAASDFLGRLLTEPGRHDDIILPSEELREKWLADVREKYTGEFSINDPNDVVVVDVEREVKDVEINGVPFLGRIDRLQAGPRGVAIVDYKSGKQPDTYKLSMYGDKESEQQALYALALMNLGESVDSAWLHYTRFGTKRQVDLSPRALDTTADKFQTAWATLTEARRTSSVIATPPKSKKGGLCNWCPLAQVCPVSKAKPENLATDLAKTSHELGIATRRTVTPFVSKEKPMSARFALYDDVPMAETDPEGNLHFNSYAAAGAVGLSAHVLELMHRDQITPKTEMMAELTQVLCNICVRARVELDGSPSLQGGMATRVRNALYSVLEVAPPPWRQDVETWQKWADKCVKRCVIVVVLGEHGWRHAKDTPTFEALSQSAPA